MFRMSAGDGTGGRSRLALWLLGIAVTGFGIWGFFHFFVVTRITACRFDANGAYAEVRVGLLGDSEVWVDFYLDGREYTYAGRYDVGFRTVIRAPFPRADDHVSGRTVYVIRNAAHPFTVKFVTRKFAEAHPALTQTEVVPDAAHTLTCGFDYTDPD
jgi:hypothetical protein